MDPQTSFVLASIASGLASVCVVLSLWSFVRLTAVETKTRALDDKMPPVRIRELEGAFDALTTAFEVLQQKNNEWKGSVHNSVQRLDNIMRRNEATQSALLDDDGNLQGDVVKVDPSEVEGLAPPDEVGISKQKALRLRYNRNRGV